MESQALCRQAACKLRHGDCQGTCSPRCSSTGHCLSPGCQGPGLCQPRWACDADRCLLGPGMRSPDSSDLWLQTDVGLQVLGDERLLCLPTEPPPHYNTSPSPENIFPNLKVAQGKGRRGNSPKQNDLLGCIDYYL